MSANHIFQLLTIVSLISCSSAQQESETPVVPVSEEIRINQVGYYPSAPKIAVIKGTPASQEFYLATVDLSDTLFEGKFLDRWESPYSGASTYMADFSGFKREGEFVVVVPGLGKSYPVKIGENIHSDLAKASMKSYYFQRASSLLLPDYAERWARPAGHPDTQVYVHASAVSPARPEGFVISAPKGWYDAGDYNKYIVNSGITMGTIFSLYEDFPDHVKALTFDIPEKDNQLPDMLDESLWNLRWMLAMQDPNDGGVYHKLTTAEFEKMIMPAEATNKRYVVQKSTAAALNFTAVMAQAARIFKNFEGQTPGLADSCLIAAKKAYEWALKNPEVYYEQDENNKRYLPAVQTGAYGDNNVEDEFIWAASELWASTGDYIYLENIELQFDQPMKIPSWSQVAALGYYTLLRHQDKLPDKSVVSKLKDNLLQLTESLVKNTDENAYGTVMGGKEKDFVWGSNAVAGNQAIALLYAYKESGNKQYLDFALHNLDYILGRNATGYSFVTGFGAKTPLYIHHRPSEADDIAEPVPGLLAGGPNPGQQDKCEYASDFADESYVDHSCSYASNEIAINWNAPLVYLVNALEALQHQFKNANAVQ